MSMRKNKSFSLRNVTMKDSYLINAFEKEVLYLTAFDTDRLLAGFRETAGVDMRGVERYPGWESMLIGGHTLGHFMTACVRCCESANCKEEDRRKMLQILKRLAEGLKECQEAANTGFLFGAIIHDKNNVELQFDYVEENKTHIITQAWVPWYTMHKLFEGLVSVVNMDVDGELAESIKATTKEVTSRLADWTYGRTSSWDEALHKVVLGIEYGGMNDCLYDVYLITGKEEHLAAAKAFDQVELFERVLKAGVGDNVLNNHHANTTIPKFVGALKRYTVTGEEQFFRYAEHFWKLVTENHTYITGGNSEWEHFGEDNILNKERTNCNCETCNVYNMLKMTKLFFMITGDVKYADWYENTFINSILSSQNPKDGMTTYFQPMASGYYKVYGERFNKFWCCTGTGMENFSKLQESFYFEKEDTLIVNQYMASKVLFKGVEIEQQANIPASDKVKFLIKGALDAKILLRLPYWLADEAEIVVNGCGHDYEILGTETGKGYALVEGPFSAGTEIEVRLPLKVVAYNLPDGKNTYAFKYGPVVLSALLGTKDMIDSTTGVNVTIPSNRIIESKYVPSRKEFVVVSEGTVEEYIADIEKHLVRQGEELKFRLQDTDASLTYVPHFSQHKERYGIYFEFIDKETAISDADNVKAERNRIDTVQPGYGQYENDTFHNMREEGTGSVGTTAGGTNRYAKEGGSFVYTMEVDPEGTALLVTFKTADTGKGIEILAGGVSIFKEVLKLQDGDEYADVIIHLPMAAMKKAYGKFYNCRDRKVLDFEFRGIDGAESAAVCQFIYTLTE
ncbi:MAG: glycoside hydrolase family 127 protein [Lachnospiraceae bacterium]|nr:glycoside hydrolase family 127 protein [Lachnospiraceae bacterium]